MILVRSFFSSIWGMRRIFMRSGHLYVYNDGHVTIQFFRQLFGWRKPKVIAVPTPREPGYYSVTFIPGQEPVVREVPSSGVASQMERGIGVYL